MLILKIQRDWFNVDFSNIEYLEIVIYLVTNMVDIDATNKYSTTALIMASGNWYLEISPIFNRTELMLILELVFTIRRL